MAKGHYIERGLAHKDHIYKGLTEKAFECIRDSTIVLLEDLINASLPDRAWRQTEVFVAYDPRIESVSNGLKDLEKRMGFLYTNNLSQGELPNSNIRGEERIPELDVQLIQDKEAKRKIHIMSDWFEIERSLTFSRYPVALGETSVKKILDATKKEDYHGFYPPIVIARYHLPNFPTLRQFEKGIRKLPHATIFKRFEREYTDVIIRG